MPRPYFLCARFRWRYRARRPVGINRRLSAGGGIADGRDRGRLSIYTWVDRRWSGTLRHRDHIFDRPGIRDGARRLDGRGGGVAGSESLRGTELTELAAVGPG